MHNYQQMYGCRAQEGVQCWTINQVLLLGHKLHVRLGKVYFKKLYLPKITSRNKPKRFWFLFLWVFFHLKNPSVQAKHSSDCQTEGRQVSLSSSRKYHKHLHGKRGWKTCPARPRCVGAALNKCPSAADSRAPATTSTSQENTLGCTSEEDTHPGMYQ